MGKFVFLLAVFFFISIPSIGLEPVIILVGPPGAGKGTCAQFLKENHRYNHLSAGDVVRNEISKKTPIGLQIADVVRKGEPINPSIMQFLIAESIREFSEEKKPFIIDGYGRTHEEVDYLYHLLSELNLQERAFVLFFDAPDAVCKERIFHRLICNGCGRIYNRNTARPIVDGICDLCSSDLKQRMNDTPEMIDKRLGEYRNKVEFSYKELLMFFPHLNYCSDQVVNDCLSFYEKLSAEVLMFQGSALDFVKTRSSDF